MEQKFSWKVSDGANFTQIRWFLGVNTNLGSTGRQDDNFQKFTYICSFPIPN